MLPGRVRPVSQAIKTLSPVPGHPPVQRRPVHTYASGYFDNVSAIQDRPDRIQALLDNRQDNQCQSRPPQSRRPAETSHQSGRNTARVADQLAEECRTSVAGGHTSAPQIW